MDSARSAAHAARARHHARCGNARSAARHFARAAELAFGAPHEYDMVAAHAYDAAELEDIAAQYATEGYVVVRVLGPRACGELVHELFEEVVMTQPYAVPVKLWGTEAPFRGRVLNTSRSAEDPAEVAEVRRVLQAPLSRERGRDQLAEFKEKWTLHRDFGAPCDPRAFHLRGAWRVRSDERLYAIARRLTGVRALWVDINRPILKLPGHGESEFLHWDKDVFHVDFVDVRGGGHGGGGALQGKVCLTPSRLVCVPRTHTPAFQADFRAAYGPLYPEYGRPGKAKTALVENRHDPLDLRARAVQVVVPAGCAVFWSDQLLHGVTKTPLKAPTEYGFYLGYFPAGARAAYAARAGIDERDDRMRSYAEGRAPKLWPSLDPIHFYPKRWQNFHPLVKRRIDKMPPGHPSIGTRVLADGETTVPHLYPWYPATPYEAPPLTPLAERLLGATPYDDDDDEPQAKKQKRP
jgi:hypothetical protein